MEIGRVFWPVMENVFPVMLSWEMSTADEVRLIRVTLELEVCPTVTVPNSTLLGADRGDAELDAFVT